MSNNSFTALKSGLSTGIQSDSLPVKPMFTYIVAPQSSANSTKTPVICTIFQGYAPVWQGFTQVNQLTYQALINTNIQFNGSKNVCVFDCQRDALITFNIPTLATTVVTINGWDDKGVLVTWTSVELPVGTTSVSSLKCFLVIQSVYFSSSPWPVPNSADTITIQGGDKIGLPYFINTSETVVNAIWDDMSAASVVIPGVDWRNGNVINTSYDARGYADLSSLTQPNGTILLNVFFYVYGFDQEIETQLNNLLPNNYTNSSYIYSLNSRVGSCVDIVQIDYNASGNACLTSLVTQDRFGLQYPGDNEFAQYYANLLLK